MKLSKTEELFLKAYHYNWDDGIKNLDRIISNKACDKSTALLIYWLGCPEYYNKYQVIQEVPEYELPVYILLKKIEKLILEEKFNEIIQFIPEKSERLPLEIPKELGNIPIEMTRPSNGKIRSQDLIDGNNKILKLLKACRNGDLETIKKIIDNNEFDINQKIDGNYLIELAVIAGHIKIVEFLISNGANIKIKTGPNGFTLHHWACQSGRHNISELLCNKGLHIDVSAKWKRTALHQNVYYENDNWVTSKMSVTLEFLLEKGANPFLKDIDGLDAFDLAKLIKNDAALEILNKHIASNI
ncbi:DUF4274 domain-containing protein [Aureivirga sp. CE67]|uniref:DUF4274 domain-containing protein n=1 Tax=Aureivirga sp. CE67 TaxID=1788983 RepID=UPI0018CBE2D1|nr:DUF4274 domain-containing protein [Aureivirga sp. CE67]